MRHNLYSRRNFLKLGTTALLGTVASLTILKTAGCNSAKGKMRMQSPWLNDAEFIGYFVAMEKGYYKDENIEYMYLPGGPEIVSDSVLLVKGAEIALTTPEVTINAIIKQKAPFKIVGAQYQKSPLGIVSLEENGITKPQDLIGKTLAVPPANNLTVDAFLKINNIDKAEVKIVPYQYDPTPLLNGEVDASLDFVTNIPFTIRERGRTPSSFLLYDYGFRIFNDTIVVREETLDSESDKISAWLRASRKGWEENFSNPASYPPQFADTYFKGTGRTTENEIFFNQAQQSLIQSSSGIFAMSEEAIQNNIKSLQAVGIDAKREMFITGLI